MVDALDIKHNYKELIDKLVCSTERSECMILRCPICPSKDTLISDLNDLLGALDVNVNMEYIQWVTTDKTTLETYSSSLPEFMDLLIDILEQHTVHSFTGTAQSAFLKKRKCMISEVTIILLLDFAENYSFTMQDEIQSFNGIISWQQFIPSLYIIQI